MKHRLWTSTILITAATASWRVLLTQWKKKLTAHLFNVDCFVCSWLITERKWTCVNVMVQFWNVEDPDSNPSSGWLREKLLLLFQYISVFQPYLSATPELHCFQLPNFEFALTKPSSLDHWTHAMRLTISATFISYIHALAAMRQGLLTVWHAFELHYNRSFYYMYFTKFIFMPFSMRSTPKEP